MHAANITKVKWSLGFTISPRICTVLKHNMPKQPFPSYQIYFALPRDDMNIARREQLYYYITEAGKTRRGEWVCALGSMLQEAPYPFTCMNNNVL